MEKRKRKAIGEPKMPPTPPQKHGRVNGSVPSDMNRVVGEEKHVVKNLEVSTPKQLSMEISNNANLPIACLLIKCSMRIVMFSKCK